MTIGELVKALEHVKEDVPIKNINITDHGSDRGDYYDFYIGSCPRPDEVITVKKLKEFLINDVIDKTFVGYKGGEYEMNDSSYIRLGCRGCSGNNIDAIVVKADGVYLKEQKILYYYN